MRVLPVVLLSLACLLMVGAVHAGPFASRAPGVSAGEVSVYDTWLDDVHLTVRVEVLSVGYQSYFLRATWASLNGTFWDNYTYSLYTANGNMVPYWFIAGGLQPGVSPLVGMPSHLMISLFGHVVLGDHRSIVYYDTSDPSSNYINHQEWDQATGVMTSMLVENNGSGWSAKLTYTNAWSPSPFWEAAGYWIPVFWLALPFAAAGSFVYFLVFFLIAFRDWMHMRSLRSSRSGKLGGMQWMMIKTMVIATLIVMAVIMAILIGISLAFR